MNILRVGTALGSGQGTVVGVVLSGWDTNVMPWTQKVISSGLMEDRPPEGSRLSVKIYFRECHPQRSWMHEDSGKTG